MVFYYVCDYINIATKTWLALQVVDGIYEVRQSKKQIFMKQIIAITLAALLQIINEIYMHLPFSNNLLLIIIIIGIIISVSCYKCNLHNALWVNLLTEVSLALVDFFILTCVYLTVDWLGGRKDILLFAGIWRGCYLFIYAILLLPVGYKLKSWLIGKKQEILRHRNKALILGILLLPCMVYFQKIYLQEMVNILFYQWCFFFLTFLLMVVIFFFNTIWQEIKEEDKIQRMEIAMLEGNYQSLLETYNQKSIIMHDMKNHLRTISAMIREARLEDCELYIAQIVGEIKESENVVWTNHKILDLVLNMKFQEARKAKIKVRCKSDDMSDLSLSAGEICSLFANLLDNAIEASMKYPIKIERMINIVCQRHGSKLFVSVTNFMKKEMNSQINSFLKTTKKEEELHGFGLRSVKRIIHEREGYMKIKILGEQFRIILYLNRFSN